MSRSIAAFARRVPAILMALLFALALPAAARAHGSHHDDGRGRHPGPCSSADPLVPMLARASSWWTS